ncbi:MAG: hypothetical protein HY719_00265, partial [Planctomycetes bacterium]|nr:hypothetical protein [Planctomycetota bacterium]
MSISPSDPRLTAYALGELDAAEAEEIERALEHDDDLRRRVREIRAAADAVERHLSREPLPERDSRTADAVKARRDQPVESIPSAAPAPTIPGWHTRRLAAVAAVLVVLVAGALAVMNGWMERERHGTGPVARTGGMPGNEASTGPGAADEKASRVRGRDQSVITADGATLSADVSGGSVAGGAKAVKELGLVRQFITENTPTSGVASSALPQAGATDARTAGEPDASKSPAPAYDYNARVSTPSPAAAAATPA